MIARAEDVIAILTDAIASKDEVIARLISDLSYTRHLLEKSTTALSDALEYARGHRVDDDHLVDGHNVLAEIKRETGIEP